ncbi:MAG: 16S rRNA (adenine(1518)-N(6)/adenine(1519)-N(6))-dimethyltransferase RsmA [bacterium]
MLLKYRGQHWLISQKIITKIIKTMDISNTDVFFEIGAGTGNITKLIGDVAKKVIAVELDYNHGKKLRRLTENLDKIQPIIGDFLRLRIDKLYDDVRFFGNIPYSITSPIIVKIMTEYPKYRDIHLTVQKEVALRISSSGGKSNYGFLSVIVGLNNDVEILFDIPPKAFIPKPKVNSSFIRIRKKSSEWRQITDDFIEFVHLIFRYKRKILMNSIKISFNEYNVKKIRELLSDKGFNEKVRVEDLKPEFIYEIYKITARRH